MLRLRIILQRKRQHEWHDIHVREVSEEKLRKYMKKRKLQKRVLFLAEPAVVTCFVTTYWVLHYFFW